MFVYAQGLPNHLEPRGPDALTSAHVALGRRVSLRIMRYVYPARGQALTPFALLMSAVGGRVRGEDGHTRAKW